MGDRALDLLNSSFINSLFVELNPCQRANGWNNCYAAANSLFKWIESGIKQPAVCIGPRQGLILTPDQWTRSSLPQIMRHVRRGGHGSQVIVQGIRPQNSRFAADHAFNIVNIDPPDGTPRRNHGSVHLVDAYSNVLIPSYPNPTFQQSTTEITSYIRHNQMVRFSYRQSGYSVRVVNNP